MSPRLYLQPREVLAAVAEHYGVSQHQLRHHRRAREPLAGARRVLLSLLHSECGISWASAADYLGIAPGGSVQGTAELADPAVVIAVRRRLLELEGAES